MKSHSRVDPITGVVERGTRSLEKDAAKERWQNRRDAERDYAKKRRQSPIVEQAHTTLEELKSALNYARQAS